MTLPTVVPAQFAATANDFNRAKADRSGAVRSSNFLVTVPVSTVAGTIIGLVPVKKGARLHLPACRITSDALDTNNAVTASVGIVYNDTVNNTTVANKYASAVTTLQGGGAITLLTTDAADSYVATGDGWLAITTAAATSTTQGTIHGVIAITYDASLQ